MAFVDISGFTALARRLTRQGAVGSEELSDILHAVFSALLAHARREGGDLVKWGGDAVLLLFRGADHATRAVRAAVDMRTELRTAGRASRRPAGEPADVRGPAQRDFHFFLVGDPRCTASWWSAVRGEPDAEIEVLATPARCSSATSHGGAARHASVPARPSRVPGSSAAVRRHGASPTPSIDRKARWTSRSLLTPPLREHLLGPRELGAPRRRGGVRPVLGDRRAARLRRAGGPRRGPGRARAQRPGACARPPRTFLESDIGRNGGKLMLVSGAPGGGRDVEDRILGTARLVSTGPSSAAARGCQPRGVFGGDFGPTTGGRTREGRRDQHRGPGHGEDPVGPGARHARGGRSRPRCRSMRARWRRSW